MGNKTIGWILIIGVVLWFLIEILICPPTRCALDGFKVSLGMILLIIGVGALLISKNNP